MVSKKREIKDIRSKVSGKIHFDLIPTSETEIVRKQLRNNVMNVIISNIHQHIVERLGEEFKSHDVWESWGHL